VLVNIAMYSNTCSCTGGGGLCTQCETQLRLSHTKLAAASIHDDDEHLILSKLPVAEHGSTRAICLLNPRCKLHLNLLH
jgi:hypothetical protein